MLCLTGLVAGLVSLAALSWLRPGASLRSSGAEAPVGRRLASNRVLWIPLDSRPVNTNEVELFGAAAGYRVILPPRQALDWYAATRSDFSGLLTWLKAESQPGDLQVLSTNNLLSGSLIASRDGLLHGSLNSRLRQVRDELRRLPPGRRTLVHVLPRLLPTQFAADGSPHPDWRYRELLAERSRLLHRRALRALPVDLDRLEKVEAALPEATRQRADDLIRTHERIVAHLIEWVKEGLVADLIVGLDDAAPEGMANLLHQRAEERARSLGVGDRVTRHFGADEIGFLVLAREGLRRAGVRPVIRVEYGDQRAPELILPYEGTRLGESVAGKLRFLGARQAPGDGATLFVHTAPAARAPTQAAALLGRMELARSAGRGVAVADVTDPGARDPLLLSNLAARLPLSAVDLAGWNTASNAVGTAIAMAAVSELHRQRRVSRAQVEALLSFRALRVGYDWVYQAHKDELSRWAVAQKIDPERFGPGLDRMRARLQERFVPAAKDLVRRRFGGQLSDLHGYARVICPAGVEAEFRWDRTFEIELRTTVRLAEPASAGRCTSH